MDDIAVLIPCYNEETTIEKCVLDCRQALPDAKIYVYDNNSTDDTAFFAENAGAIVRFTGEKGKGNVVRDMFHQIDADCYIIIDGDDTYDISNISQMVSIVLNDKIDMVIGDRLSSTYFEENKRPFHNFGNKLVSFLINHLFSSDYKFIDAMSGFRAFSRNFVKSMYVESNGFEIETEMDIWAINNNAKIANIVVKYKDRSGDSFSKLNTIKDGFKIIKFMISAKFKCLKTRRFLHEKN